MIMNKRSRAFLLLMAVCWLSQSASGEIFTVEDNIPGPVYLGYSSVSGSFDFNPVLSPGAGYVAPYDVKSGYYVMKFQDDADLTLQNVYTSEWVFEGFWPIYGHYWRTRSYLFYDEYERVQVRLEGEYSADGGTTWFDTDWVYNGYYVDDPWYDFPAYTYYYDRTVGYKGSLTIVQSLGTSALDSLSLDGIVNFTITPTYGDIYYISGTMTADIVPVPGAVLLGLLGLSVAGIKLRKHA